MEAKRVFLGVGVPEGALRGGEYFVPARGCPGKLSVAKALRVGALLAWARLDLYNSRAAMRLEREVADRPGDGLD